MADSRVAIIEKLALGFDYVVFDPFYNSCALRRWEWIHTLRHFGIPNSECLIGPCPFLQIHNLFDESDARLWSWSPHEG
jgi:hypothetical protein